MSLWENVFTATTIAPSTSSTIIGRQNDALTQGFESAQWIWTPEYGVTSPIAPPGSRAFRKTYTPPSGLAATSANILMTVDNYYTLYVCGTQVGSTQAGDGEGWRTSQLYHVSISGSGPIVFAIEGVNLPDLLTGADTYAGVLSAIQVTHSDGSTAMITSGSSWRASNVIPDNFYLTSFDDSSWENPNSLGAYGVSPWLTNVTIATSGSGTLSVTASGVSSKTSTPSTSTTTSTVGTAHVSSSSPLSSSSTTGSSNIENTFTTVAGSTVASASIVSSTDPPVTSSVAQAIQQTSPVTKSTSIGPIGPIVGGVIGGVLVLAVLVFAVFCLLRKRKYSYSQANLTVVQPSSENLLIRPFTLTASPMPPSRMEKANVSTTVGSSTSGLMYQEQDSETSSSAVSASGQLRTLQIMIAQLDKEIVTKEGVTHPPTLPPPYQLPSGPIGAVPESLVQRDPSPLP